MPTFDIVKENIADKNSFRVQNIIGMLYANQKVSPIVPSQHHYNDSSEKKPVFDFGELLFIQ